MLPENSTGIKSVGTADPELLYRDHVNPQWARLLDVLGMNVRYTRCQGTVLETEDGRRILDFLSGYCVHNTGHNHPYIVTELKEELGREGPAMVQSHVPDLAGELLLDKSSFIRRRTLAAFQDKPELFQRMLSVHVGKLPLANFGVGPLAQFGWELVTA